MTIEAVIELASKGLLTILFVVGPPLLAAMTVGLIIAVIQAATQIQESSLTFVPKIAVVGFTLLITGRWSIGHLVSFLKEVMERVSSVNM